MNKFSFKIDRKITELSNQKYVAICAGKGNKENSRVYIDEKSFSYLEGLIWDKYREYRSSRKTKISSEDIKRIVDGVAIANEKLISNKVKDIQKILKFELYSPLYSINNILDDIENFSDFLNQFMDCILEFSKKDKYVLIIRKDA